MRIFLFAVAFLIAISFPFNSSGQAARQKTSGTQSPHYLALLIGIDHYAPPPGYLLKTNDGRIMFPNLSGCKNDAISMASILTSKFHVQWNSMKELFDTDASRDGILSALNNLLQESKRGDVVFIYAASHGSQVRNSLSKKIDKWDESMVPSDIWKEGVRDIRDKEFSRIFNEFLDKGVKLTVIFDFCHSGSISRGPNNNPDKVRWMPASLWDARDPSVYPIPEERKENNFLIFSACQSNEVASETTDDHGTPHGAFTNALMQALNQESVDASASTIFFSAAAILKSNGKIQEPVIGGTDLRQEQTLLGIKKGEVTDYSVIPVIKGLGGNSYLLYGGFALGLSKDNDLEMVGSRKDTIRLRVDKVLDPVHSTATLIKGSATEVKPGSQFKVINWVSSDRPLLKIYVPKSTMTEAEVNQFMGVANQLKQSSKIVWLADIGKGKPDPYVSVYWRNSKCYIKKDTSDAKEITDFSAENILQYCTQDSTLYVEIPISAAHSNSIVEKLQELKNVAIENVPGRANYVLFGKLGKDSLPLYGFRKTEVAARDSLESMPIMTDCFAFLPSTYRYNVLNNLEEQVMKLSKIRGWLTLKAPDATKNGFGYHLEIYNLTQKGPLKNNRYRIGDKISLRMVTDKDSFPASTPKSYIYVFNIDQSGNMNLFYPNADGNDVNQFPKFDSSGKNAIHVVMISDDNNPVVVSEPTGTDNYFLLTCASAIQNAKEIFNQTGVLNGASRGAGDPNPLAQLVNMGNTLSRGTTPPTPANWSLQRISVKCVY
jgi:hypothetical protein